MGMDIKVTTNNCDVLSNGSILISNNQDLIFKIADLTYVLKFVSNTTVTGPKVESNNDNASKTMTLTFSNFNNTLGIYNTEPIVLGFLNGKQLLFNYRISRANHLPDSNQILVYYTWFLTKGENNAK